MNNSTQASAKNIWLTIDYTKEEELNRLIIKKIIIKDDGIGVHIDDLERKILDIGTKNKEGGKGIGRFAAFQIGKNIEIETVGFSQGKKTYSKVYIPLSFDSFGNNINVSKININTKEEILKDTNHNTYYQVTITNFYDDTVTNKEPKKKIIDKMLEKNICNSIFERYPLKIFNRDIKFHINNQLIDPNDFVIGKPTLKNISYKDRKENEHNIKIRFFNIKNVDKQKVFLTTNNAGIQTIASGFEFEAKWLSPKIGGWFIYVASDNLPSDLYRNIGLDGMDEEVKAFKLFIKP